MERTQIEHDESIVKFGDWAEGVLSIDSEGYYHPGSLAYMLAVIEQEHGRIEQFAVVRVGVEDYTVVARMPNVSPSVIKQQPPIIHGRVGDNDLLEAVSKVSP